MEICSKWSSEGLVRADNLCVTSRHMCQEGGLVWNQIMYIPIHRGGSEGVRRGYATMSSEIPPLKVSQHCHPCLSLPVCRWRIPPILKSQQWTMVTAFSQARLAALGNKTCISSFSIWPLTYPLVHTNLGFELPLILTHLHSFLLLSRCVSTNHDL